MYYSIGYVLCFYANFHQISSDQDQVTGTRDGPNFLETLKFSALPVTTCFLKELRSIRNAKNSNNPDRKISGGPTRVHQRVNFWHVTIMCSPVSVRRVSMLCTVPQFHLRFSSRHITRLSGCA